MVIDCSALIIKDLHSETAFDGSVISFLKDWYSAEKTVKVQSSGSTGTPKIFDVEKQKMLNSAKMTCNFLDLKPGNTALLCLPIEYISGKMMVVRSIHRNLKLITSEPSTSPLKNLVSKVDFCAMTPLQVENSLEKLYLIKKLIIGGAAVSEVLKNKIFAAIHKESTTIFETYGMSETLSHIAMRQIFPNPKKYFKTLPGVTISVDERSCLEICAPELNEKILKTNDIVEIKNANEFRFLGRADNIINSGGAKIFPEELETVVKKQIPNEAVFIGVPDEILGEKLVLIIETQNSDLQLPEFNFQKSFHKPKEILFLEKIPRLPNGKIDRMQLKQNFSDGSFQKK